MINRVVLVGRLTKDPVLRKTQSQNSVTSFSVAVKRRFQTQDQQTTDFINCVAWNKTADFLAQYAKKGALIGVDGRIQTRNYDDANGRRVYVTEVVCDSAQLLESKAASENRSHGGYGDDSHHDSNPGYYPDDNSDNGGNMDDYSSGPSLDISSDDLPF